MPQVICNHCHTLTPAAAFEKTGCAQRVKLPPCGNDDETGIISGEGHLTPTPAEAPMLNRHWQRTKAMSMRQAASAAARQGKSANLVTGGEDDYDDCAHHIHAVGAATSASVTPQMLTMPAVIGGGCPDHGRDQAGTPG